MPAGPLLTTVQRLIASDLPRPDLLARTVAAVGEAFDFIDVGVLLVDPHDAAQLILRASNYAGFPDAVDQYRQPRAGGVIGRALRQGRQLLVADVQQDPDYQPLPGVAIAAELVTPLWVGGALVGVLNVESEHPITPETAAAVGAVAALLSAALEARTA